MAKLDDAAERQKLADATAALRTTAATWTINRSNPDSPLISDEVIEIVATGFKELVEGFDEGSHRWANREQPSRMVFQTVPSLIMENKLIQSRQLSEFVDHCIARGTFEKEEKPAVVKNLAEGIVGRTVKEAIDYGEKIGLNLGTRGDKRIVLRD